MRFYSIGILSFSLLSVQGERIDTPQHSATELGQLPPLFTRISSDRIKRPLANSIEDQSISEYNDYEQRRELIDRWYNEIFLQLPLCPQPDRTKTQIPTSCRPLPTQFTPYAESCDMEKERANCNLRTSVPFNGYTVYGPDYSGIEPSNCTALRKTWLQASSNWLYNARNWAT